MAAHTPAGSVASALKQQTTVEGSELGTGGATEDNSGECPPTRERTSIDESLPSSLHRSRNRRPGDEEGTFDVPRSFKFAISYFV